MNNDRSAAMVELSENMNGNGRTETGRHRGQISLPQGGFCRQLCRTLRSHCGVRPQSHLLVAVSGGADSTALLLGLTALAERSYLAYRLTVAHVHHHLRAQADSDAAGVAELAGRLGLDFNLLHVAKESYGQSSGISAVARQARYGLLADLAKKVDADGIVTGHHGDDQLETILMALMRGAGLRGLAGMAWRSERLDVPVLRPLLGLSHEECEQVCRECGVPWFEDSSNSNVNQLRNRLRGDVIPRILAIAPDLNHRVSRTGDQMRSAADFVECEASRIIASRGQGGVFDRELLANLNQLLLGAVLRRVAGQLGCSEDSLSFELIARSIDCIRRGKVCELDWPGGMRLQVEASHVLLSRNVVESNCRNRLCTLDRIKSANSKFSREAFD